MNLFDLWAKAQEAWLQNCIKFYGHLLNGAGEMIKFNKTYHEKMQQTVKVKPDEDK